LWKSTLVSGILSVILGVLVLGNPFSTSTLVGGVLIAAAVLVIEWSSMRVAATA